MSEVYRVCKKMGYIIISTENLSSFDNLFALFLGYQAFSQNLAKKLISGIDLARTMVTA